MVEYQKDSVVSREVISKEKGTVTIMPTNQPHAVKAPRRFKMILIMIRD